MKRKKIEVPIFCCEIMIVKVDRITDANKILKRNDIKEWYGAFVDRPKPREYVAVFVNGETHGDLIAHESLHLANYVIEDCGIVTDVINDECQAYLVGWFFKTLNKYLN